MLDPQHMCKLVSMWWPQGFWEPPESLCLNTSLVEQRHQESDKSAYAQGIQSLHKASKASTKSLHRLHWLQGVGFSSQTQTQKCRYPQNHKQAYQCPAGISIWSILTVLQEQFQNHHGSVSSLAAPGRCLRWSKTCQKQQTVEIRQVNWAKISCELLVSCSRFLSVKLREGFISASLGATLPGPGTCYAKDPVGDPCPSESLVGYSKEWVPRWYQIPVFRQTHWNFRLSEHKQYSPTHA